MLRTLFALLLIAAIAVSTGSTLAIHAADALGGFVPAPDLGDLTRIYR